jgi:glycosyltransferase involved in cell wall biosynthesis
MKIAILADFPLGALTGGSVGRGGGQGCTWLPQLAQAFQKFQDLEIHWVVLDRSIRKARIENHFGQHFHRVPAVKFSIDLALNYLPARRALLREIRAIRPDLVHAWGTESIHPCALAGFQGPSILSMQGILTEYQRIGGLPDDWRWRRLVRSEKSFIRSATIVTSESQWGIDKVRAVHPAADCRMVEYGVHPSFYEIPWQPDPVMPYLLYVGGSGTRKGLDVLLDAMRLLPDRNWELRLAGDPGIGSEVAAAGIPGVRYLGMLAWPEMIHQLQHAWAFTLPTRGDTSPNSVKEARVIGLPVITTQHGGQAGYIQDGVNGRIVDPLQADNLAAALADVMGSHERAVSLGRGRHAEDRDYLHPHRTAEGFAEIYRELAGTPHQR